MYVRSVVKPTGILPTCKNMQEHIVGRDPMYVSTVGKPLVVTPLFEDMLEHTVG